MKFRNSTPKFVVHRGAGVNTLFEHAGTANGHDLYAMHNLNLIPETHYRALVSRMCDYIRPLKAA